MEDSLAKLGNSTPARHIWLQNFPSMVAIASSCKSLDFDCPMCFVLTQCCNFFRFFRNYSVVISVLLIIINNKNKKISYIVETPTNKYELNLHMSE